MSDSNSEAKKQDDQLKISVELMTIQKRIVLTSIWMVMFPALLTVLLWTGYEYFHKREIVYPVRRTWDGGDSLNEMINALYTYEVEINGMDWEQATVSGEQGAVPVLKPDTERIEELESLGYHFMIEAAGRVIFTNMDNGDLHLLSENINTGSEGVYWSENGLLIERDLVVNELPCSVNWVYDRERVDHGVEKSQTTLYMIPRGLSQILLISAVICFAITVWVVSLRVERAVMIPLLELIKETGKVAEGNLEDRIAYEGRDEFGDVFTAFENMRCKLKESGEQIAQYEEQRKEMVAGISHDLRSPLTSIKGYAMGLRDGIADTEEKKRRYCDAILTRSADLERLTESLSLLVRLERDGSWLHPERVCLDEYIRQLLEEKQAWLKEQKVDVSYRTEAPEAEVLLDIREMQRVFANLFDNTVRYRTSERSKVEIDVRQSSGEVKICFTDDGPGVAPKHIDHIFENFYRADESRTTPEKGSGIGLAVVRQIIEGQNGQICASSENGLCIEMTLPVLEEAFTGEKNIDR